MTHVSRFISKRYMIILEDHNFRRKLFDKHLQNQVILRHVITLNILSNYEGVIKNNVN